MSDGPVYPIVTRDPVSGGELLVTRLESPETGVVLEGRFSLGWVGRLTREQLDFVGLLLQHRNNLQRLASELGVAYNTARARLDEIVAALGGPPAPAAREPDPAAERERDEIMDSLARGEISFDDAKSRLEHLRA